MKRWHDDVRTMLRQLDVQKLSHKWSGEREFPLDPLGRFRKKHALDCGKTKCGICHWEKIRRIKTYKEKIADQETEEQMKEFVDKHKGET